MAERTPTYIDFANGEVKELETGDSIPPSMFQLPIGYVVSNTTNTDPATELGYGTWDALGSLTVGTTTVYFFENIAP